MKTVTIESWNAKDERQTQLTDELEAEQVVSSEATVDHGDVRVDMVAGLPARLVETYADLVRHHALAEEIEPGVWFARDAWLEGPWGEGASPDAALDSLREAVIDWVAVKRRLGQTNIPTIDGIDLNVGSISAA